MPNISGIETAKFLNDKYRDVDVIFITGHTEYAMVGHKLHCSSFVTKPFDENDIAEALKWLRNPIKSEKVLKV
ncbi:MAG: response regulator, partial [Ruminococcus sp.]|nr:response regulator [Ruminococcus sp.]